MVGGKFILQNMVEEKENRMRETLRIMSLTPLSYGTSFLLFTAIFAVINGLIVGIWVYDNNGVFMEDPLGRSKQFTLLLILF
jgi:uncharacterized protein (DUF2062 family)